MPSLRVWDIDPALLCREHLLGEHREVHAVWSVITRGKVGYSRHPETMRWHGRLAALHARHEALTQEMEARGYNHRSPLDAELASGDDVQTVFVNTPEEQIGLLKAKQCGCRV